MLLWQVGQKYYTKQTLVWGIIIMLTFPAYYPYLLLCVQPRNKLAI